MQQFIVSNNSADSMTWYDCADAQDDLGLRCPHMPEDLFSHGAACLDLEEYRVGQEGSLYNTVQLQSNFNGSNTFGTMEKCSKHG